MELDIKLDCADVNWPFVAETLKRVGMAYSEPAAHQKSFENSQVTVFIHNIPTGHITIINSKCPAPKFIISDLITFFLFILP